MNGAEQERDGHQVDAPEPVQEPRAGNLPDPVLVVDFLVAVRRWLWTRVHEHT
jgi:hypothetical protein